MSYKSIKKNLCAVLIAAFLVSLAKPAYYHVPAAPSDVYADELSEAQNKKKEASAKKKEAEKKLNSLKQSKNDALAIIKQFDDEIMGYEEKIRQLDEKKIEMQAQSAVVENTLQEAYIKESRQYAGMKERIQFAYENGDVTYISALLSIKDYSSVTNRPEYIDKVSLYDQKQLDELLEIEDEISKCKDQIASNLDEVENLKAEASGEKEALTVMQDGKKEALKEFDIQIAETEYSIEQIEAMEREQDAQIAAIEAAAAAARAAAEAAAKAEAEKAAAAAAAANSTASATDASSTSDTSTTTTMESHSGGGFVWPCPASRTITSGFGSRTSPTAGASSNHRGIDIGCASGSRIVAAANGFVSFTGYFGSGGQTVIIDHGNGLSTLYMHLSAFAVSQGTNVKAGTVIGYAGSTGVSTGPHLHFGVRQNGVYVNPLGYL